MREIEIYVKKPPLPGWLVRPSFDMRFYKNVANIVNDGRLEKGNFSGEHLGRLRKAALTLSSRSA
jgi:hypothetical protein